MPKNSKLIAFVVKLTLTLLLLIGKSVANSITQLLTQKILEIVGVKLLTN